MNVTPEYVEKRVSELAQRIADLEAAVEEILLKPLPLPPGAATETTLAAILAGGESGHG